MSTELPHGERIQKVLFPARKKRVQFSSERSLRASKLPGNIGRQGSSILRFVGFTSNLFFQATFGQCSRIQTKGTGYGELGVTARENMPELETQNPPALGPEPE